MSFRNLDQSQLQDLFPALRNDQVFLDNAGGSQILSSALTSITDFLTHTNVQLGATYKTSQAATERYSAAYTAGARFINAHPDEVVFGSSTTQLLRNLSTALTFESGDDIIVSAIDHEANISPWVDLAQRQGLNLKWWRPSDPVNPRLLPEDLIELLGPRTKLVACTHSSNVTGTITNIRTITATAHAAGALVCVDGVAYAPHRRIDVEDLGVDFYTFSWYKVFGPHVAMLYASWRAQTRVRTLGHFFNPRASLEEKLGLAGASYELCAAIPAVVEYIMPKEDESLWRDIEEHEKSLHDKVVNSLLQIPDVTIYGIDADAARSGIDVWESQDRVPTVSFSVKGQSSKAIVEAVQASSNYGFRWGSFYSQRLVRDVMGLGPEGVVRISMAHYNTMDQVDRLCNLLSHNIAAKFI